VIRSDFILLGSDAQEPIFDWKETKLGPTNFNYFSSNKHIVNIHNLVSKMHNI